MKKNKGFILKNRTVTFFLLYSNIKNRALTLLGKENGKYSHC